MKENWFLFNDSYVSKSTSYDAIDNNFGGVNNGFDFTRNYSAYILIYVRVDSIDEIFMKSQNEATKSFKIPRNVSYLAEEGNRKELQSKKSDNLCQITFNIFNERCLIENLTKGIVDICNDENKKQTNAIFNYFDFMVNELPAFDFFLMFYILISSDQAFLSFVLYILSILFLSLLIKIKIK